MKLSSLLKGNGNDLNSPFNDKYKLEILAYDCQLGGMNIVDETWIDYCIIKNSSEQEVNKARIKQEKEQIRKNAIISKTYDLKEYDKYAYDSMLRIILSKNQRAD